MAGNEAALGQGRHGVRIRALVFDAVKAVGPLEVEADRSVLLRSALQAGIPVVVFACEHSQRN